MSKHITQDCFYLLPSQSKVHPCRLITRDGTLMWKHALLYQNTKPALPTEEAHEQHIIKTAQRLEELNSWVSHGLEPWECFNVRAWYQPDDTELNKGISVYFNHSTHDLDYTYDNLLPHIQSHETLEVRSNYLFFRRC
jgi:hypothetical protein